MRLKNLKETKAISAVAKHHDISDVKVKEEIQHSIDIAMGNVEFVKMFGEGVRPSPEEFIRVIANVVKDESKKK